MRCYFTYFVITFHSIESTQLKHRTQMDRLIEFILTHSLTSFILKIQLEENSCAREEDEESEMR